MRKKLLYCLIVSLLFAKDNSGDIFSTISKTLDTNATDTLKLQSIQSYLKDIKFDDNVDKSKYKFNVMGHHANYMLFGSYSTTSLTEKSYIDAYNRDRSKEYTRDTNEAQFQLSIKVPLYANFLNTSADLFVAYTQNSYWQVYNTDHSSPFRETNYMPELFLEWHPQVSFGSNKLIKSRFSFIHQSNGQDVGKSRSWNRAEASFLFNNNKLYYGANIWFREKEELKLSATATKGDDNPNLEKYIGKQKYFLRYNFSNDIDITLAHQNQILHYDKNYGNTNLDIYFPSVNKNLKFYLKAFYGYGESLIDYDQKLNRVSFGILISDWL